MSRSSAPDIDGWIAQAKQLQADIERSKETANSVVREAELAREIQSQVNDASSKIALLQGELAFNEALVDTLQDVGRATERLDSAQDAVAHKKTVLALEALEDTNATIARLKDVGNTRVMGLLYERAGAVRASLEEDTMRRWDALVVVNRTDRQVTINGETQGRRDITFQPT